ncbi:uncharacterized protein LOC130614590 [Hydractinia symbiolongicarpus]|uniref:uncharacterized protein LOC130614590 n=1 Tax=Hydractinia symbiolongicarpus TaxID=13093 RepID=UPI00254A1CFC|nr:uncharacterized protein LOC130614590 [Hydractinia symbiolongicarpus]
MVLKEQCSGDAEINLTNDEREIVTWRCNLSFTVVVERICNQHYSKYVKIYTLHQRKCCDPFKLHRKTVTKRLSTVTINLAKHMRNRNFADTPGQKICDNCRKKLAAEEDLSQTEDEELDNCGEDYQPHEIQQSFKDSTLSDFRISPIKKHSKSERHKHIESKQKLARVQEKLSYEVGQCYSLASPSSSPVFLKKEQLSEFNQLERKARSFEELIHLIKEKINNTTDKREIMRLLTIVPSSWTIRGNN